MKKYQKITLISVCWILSLIGVAYIFGIGGYALGTAESIVTSQVATQSSNASTRAMALGICHLDENERSEPLNFLEDMLTTDVESYYSFKDQLAWYTPKFERFNLFTPLQTSELEMRLTARYVRNYFSEVTISQNESLKRLLNEYPDTH